MRELVFGTITEKVTVIMGKITKSRV